MGVLSLQHASKAARLGRWQLLLVGFLLLVSSYLLISPWHRSGADPELLGCVNNLKCIVQAVDDYRKDCGHYPPPYTVDAKGQPMHSWRVLILPYLGEKDLFERYDFDEPWDGPNNRKLISTPPKVYSCPADDPRHRKVTTTSYFAVIGPGTPWLQNPQSQTAQEGHSIMIVEVSGATVQWTEPKDISLGQAMCGVNTGAEFGISSKHGDGAHVVLTDGEWKLLCSDIDPKELESLLTGNQKTERRERQTDQTTGQH
jgi:hypothetical protein